VTQTDRRLGGRPGARSSGATSLGGHAVVTRSRSALALLIAALAGLTCFGPGARLSPQVVGCYRVSARAWSAAHARITGFGSLPDVIALDTARLGRILVPQSWRVGGPNSNTASLHLYLPPWRWEGDSLVFDRYSRPHAIANDSVILRFSGWGGTLTAFLERRGESFEGYGFLEPQQLARHVPAVRVRLERADCPSDLGEGLPPRRAQD